MMVFYGYIIIYIYNIYFYYIPRMTVSLTIPRVWLCIRPGSREAKNNSIQELITDEVLYMFLQSEDGTNVGP